MRLCSRKNTVFIIVCPSVELPCSSPTAKHGRLCASEASARIVPSSRSSSWRPTNSGLMLHAPPGSRRSRRKAGNSSPSIVESSAGPRRRPGGGRSGPRSTRRSDTCRSRGWTCSGEIGRVRAQEAVGEPLGEEHERGAGVGRGDHGLAAAEQGHHVGLGGPPSCCRAGRRQVATAVRAIGQHPPGRVVASERQGPGTRGGGVGVVVHGLLAHQAAQRRQLGRRPRTSTAWCAEAPRGPPAAADSAGDGGPGPAQTAHGGRQQERHGSPQDSRISHRERRGQRNNASFG